MRRPSLKDIIRYCGVSAIMALLGYAMYLGVTSGKYGLAAIAGLIFAVVGTLFESGRKPKRR